MVFNCHIIPHIYVPMPAICKYINAWEDRGEDMRGINAPANVWGKQQVYNIKYLSCQNSPLPPIHVTVK